LLHICWNGCIYSLCCGDNFMMQMMFYVNVLNTKVVYKFLILLVLKFHYFSPVGLGFIDFTSLMSAFACPLNRSEWLYCLDYLNMESRIGYKRRVVVLLWSFPKCLRTPFLVVQDSSYSCPSSNGRFCPNLDRDAFLELFNLVSCRIIFIWSGESYR